MKRWFRGKHLRLAGAAVRDRLAEHDDIEGVRLFDEDAGDGYVIVQVVRRNHKGKLRPFSFELFWDDDGRRMKLVKAEAFDSGKVLNHARIPGDMVFPWVNAAIRMLSALESVERIRSQVAD